MSRFVWDPEKARVNLAKHGVSFEEAESATAHPLAIEEYDIEHSSPQDRLRVTGWSSMDRLIVVILSISPPPGRVISARRATKRERHAYEARR